MRDADLDITALNRLLLESLQESDGIDPTATQAAFGITPTVYRSISSLGRAQLLELAAAPFCLASVTPLLPLSRILEEPVRAPSWDSRIAEHRARFLAGWMVEVMRSCAAQDFSPSAYATFGLPRAEQADYRAIRSVDIPVISASLNMELVFSRSLPVMGWLAALSEEHSPQRCLHVRSARLASCTVSAA